ncbi:branched-chain amino acid ABC transporter permease [Cupriavidus sp. UGS-1]|uniref:branched-chain amino acid ABC transporter permease n=1 Tax=Cupriavidus sp. UGS-1 TaxID=2899826 RepID=UPI001E58EA49|nr:branched-chain amino acid ABC transporter permease [Cupriavidus sp. UGS-1]MCD9120791.1 branched-chain amino acid ABC transporter permease [Cupriavidus sp. UGS-1]
MAYRFWWLALAVTLLLPLTLRSGTLATEVLIYAMAVMACNLLLGYTGLLSFGQGIFFGLGSYSLGLALTRIALPVPISLALAIAIGAGAAALVGWFSIRQRGTYFVMLTLAFSQMFYFLAYSVPSLTGGDNGLLDIPRPALSIAGRELVSLASPWQFYGFVAVLFLVVFFLVLRVTDSVFGRTLLAIRDNEERALAVGYNIKAFKLLAFVISGAVTGLAGGLHAMLTGIAPLANIDYHVSEMILIMTVIGGTANVFASVLGAAFYVLLADWLSTLWPRWLMLLGFLLIAVSLFMQRGLWGLGTTIWLRLRGIRREPAAIGPDTEAAAGVATDVVTTREERA